MPLVIWAVVLLLIVGIILWLTEIPEPLKTYIIKISVVVAVIIVILWLLGLFGWGPGIARLGG